MGGTPGAIHPNLPNKVWLILPAGGSGDIVRVIGHSVGPGSEDIIYFNPDGTWIEIA